MATGNIPSGAPGGFPTTIKTINPTTVDPNRRRIQAGLKALEEGYLSAVPPMTYSAANAMPGSDAYLTSQKMTLPGTDIRNHDHQQQANAAKVKA